MPARPLRLFFFGILIALAGCPSRTRRTLTPAVPTTGDPDARARFEAAQRTFARDATRASAEFEGIARDFPDDPIAAHARLYAGISAVRARDYQKAVENLSALDDDEAGDKLRRRGRLFLGLALNYRGEHARALRYLTGSEAVIADDSERTEWLAAMAEARSRSGDGPGSLPFYDRWHERASTAERAYILERVKGVVAKLELLAARRAYGALERKGGPTAAVLGARVAADYQAEGESARAARIRTETAGARNKVGMVLPQPVAGHVDASLVGVVLPLSGRRARVGDLVMRGLVIASGAVDRSSTANRTGVSFRLRDSGSVRSQAVSGAGDLAAAGAIALIGPVDRNAADAVAARAESLGVPLVSLAQRALKNATGSFVFSVVHSAEERARALARYAYAQGKRDFAILAPKNGYGRVVGGAFRAEVKKLGGSVVVDVEYDASTTSFGSAIRRLRKPWQALFVPDQAPRLALIAPALAAANFVSVPVNSNARVRGRKILLLSTAESITSRYLRAAARYSEGAVFAPGFYPDRFDPQIVAFVDKYEEAFKRPPTAFDAYAYDAGQVMQAVHARGARTRQEVVEALRKARVVGVTGTISFGADRRRSDDGLLYVITRRSTGDWVLRAKR